MEKKCACDKLAILIDEHRNMKRFIDNLLLGVLPCCSDIEHLISVIREVTDDYEDIEQSIIDRNIALALGKVMDSVRQHGV